MGCRHEVIAIVCGGRYSGGSRGGSSYCEGSGAGRSGEFDLRGFVRGIGIRIGTEPQSWTDDEKQRASCGFEQQDLDVGWRCESALEPGRTQTVWGDNAGAKEA